MHSLSIKVKSGENKTVRINGKYCGEGCDFKRKMFQGFGGWLGFEVEGCQLSGQLGTSGGKSVRCNECLQICKKQIKDNQVHWVNEN